MLEIYLRNTCRLPGALVWWAQQVHRHHRLTSRFIASTLGKLVDLIDWMISPKNERWRQMTLTQTVSELPSGVKKDYAGIVAEAKTAAPDWVAVVEYDLTPQQVADVAGHLRKHYATEHNLEVAVRRSVVYVRVVK
jgi:hypothetical protein